MRKQFSAAAFIGIVRPGMEEEEALARGFGLCPDMNIKIQREDLLIFVGPRPSPRCSMGMARAFAGYQEEAVRLMKAHPDIEANRQARLDQLQAQARAAGVRLAPGVAAVPRAVPGEAQGYHEPASARVVDHLPQQGARRGVCEAHGRRGRVGKGPGAYDFAGGVALKHVVGDAAQIGILKPVIDGNSIDGCIVLGTQANFRLAGIYRDTRVLNVILLLRKLCSEKQTRRPCTWWARTPGI